MGIKTANGLEILLHMGIDTVQLAGKPFDVKVVDGQEVRHGDLLADVDLKAIEDAGKKTDIMVIVTNMADVSMMKFKYLDREVNKDDDVVKITTK